LWEHLIFLARYHQKKPFAYLGQAKMLYLVDFPCHYSLLAQHRTFHEESQVKILLNSEGKARYRFDYNYINYIIKKKSHGNEFSQ
jgi:hypothetical protein